MTTWMSLQEAGKYLGVSKETMYRLTMKEAIPFHRIGKLIKFSDVELDAWMKTGAKKPVKVGKKK